MKKQVKKATARKRTNRVLKVALKPLRSLMQIVLREMQISNTEKAKMKKLENQKRYLESEANSRKNVLQYREMLLPEEREKLESELNDLLIQIKANIEKHNIVMGKRANRRKRKLVKSAVILAVCGATATASYLMTTGALTVLGF